MLTSPSASLALSNTVTPFAAPAQPVAPETDPVNLQSSIKPVEITPSVSVSVNNTAPPINVYSFQRTPTVGTPERESASNETVPSQSVGGEDQAVSPGISPDEGEPDLDPVSVSIPSNQGENPGEQSAGNESADETEVGGKTSSERAVEEQNAEIIRELAARDREVRLHEAQHKAVGGQHTGAVSFTYQTGPNGQQYAVGGEVSISVSEVSNDPQATIDKMRTVRAAALAPAEPSSQDRAVAAAATQIMLKAQQELAQSKEEARVSDQQELEARRQAREDARTESNNSEEIQTYQRFIELGRQYEQGLVPEINLDELV